MRRLRSPAPLAALAAAVLVLAACRAPASPADQYRRFAGHAREFGFLASRGSDFHAPGESRVDFGGLPPLPDSVVPVWRDWPEAASAARSLPDSGPQTEPATGQGTA
jgi:hypothetical protein